MSSQCALDEPRFIFNVCQDEVTSYIDTYHLITRLIDLVLAPYTVILI